MRFTIRDLLWLTVVVALGLGWWVHQRRLRGELEQSQSRLSEQTMRTISKQQTVENLTRAIELSGGKVSLGEGGGGSVTLPPDGLAPPTNRKGN